MSRVLPYTILLWLLTLTALLANAQVAAAKTKGPKPINVAGTWHLLGNEQQSPGEEEEEEGGGQASQLNIYFNDVQHAGGGLGGETFSYYPGLEQAQLYGSISGATMRFELIYGYGTASVETVKFSGEVAQNGESMKGSYTDESEYNTCADGKLKLETEERGEECVVEHHTFNPGSFTGIRERRIPTEEEEIEKKEEKEEKEEEEDPSITSVTDTTTGSTAGGFLGGDNLKINGVGFEPGESQPVQVIFEAFGLTQSAEAVPNSSHEVNVTVPNLSFFTDRAPRGNAPLDFNIRVRYEADDEEGEQLTLTSPVNSEAVYEAYVPDIESVTDASTGSDQGSIAGGERLTFKGSGFIVPPGGKATVSFLDEGEELGEPVEATVLGNEELQVTSPSLAKYASKIPNKEDSLTLDAVVTISAAADLEGLEEGGGPVTSEKSRVQREGAGLPGETGDTFEVVNLDVSSVVNSETGSGHGSIFGGAPLKITGSGFSVPEGGKARVLFELGKEVVSEEEVTPTSPTEISATAPNLSQRSSQVNEGRLELDIVVQISDGANQVESPVSKPGSGQGDVYDEYPPTVESVTDVDTGTYKGSILGGEELKISGSGLEAPSGGKTKVKFESDGDPLAAIEASTTNESVLEVEVPDLAADTDKANPKTGALSLEISVVTSDGHTEVASVAQNDDTLFEAYGPTVTSVIDQETGSNSGSILGGDTLTIKGYGFKAPPGGETHVSFAGDSDTFLTEDVTPESSTTITLKAPDLAAFASEGDGHALKVDLTVAVTDKGEFLNSDTGSADIFEALNPQVKSVTKEANGTNRGSVLGGEALKIEGTGFKAPSGGKTEVRFIPEGSKTAIASEEVTPEDDGTIKITSPNVVDYAQGHSGSIGEAVKLDAVVVVSDGTNEVESRREAGDLFEEFGPQVQSVIYEANGTNRGSILGGEKLKIKGYGFEAPTGGTTEVLYSVNDEEGGDSVGSEVVTPEDNGTITVTSPDLAKEVRRLADGSAALKVEVQVRITSGTTDLFSQTNSASSFEEFLPQVKRVTNEETGTDSGSIFGGDLVKIEGYGLQAPPGGKTEVRFIPEGTEFKESSVEVTPEDDGAIRVKAPNSVAYARGLPNSAEAVKYDVVVAVSDGSNEVESHKTAGDTFEEPLPRVGLVTDAATGNATGSVLGGDDLTIEGVGFQAPVGGTTTVNFAHDGNVLSSQEVTPDSDTELHVASPDLSGIVKDLKAGEHSFALEISVDVANGSEELKGAIVGDPQNFSAYVPAVDSVTELVSGEPNGPILGGERLRIQGSGFTAGDGTTTVLFERKDTVIASQEAKPSSDQEIEVTAPDLGEYAAEVQADELGLEIEVRVAVSDAKFEVVGVIEGDQENFLAEPPKVDSISNETAGTTQTGAILGGERLIIKGSGFDLSPIGEAELHFEDSDDQTVASATVTPINGQEIEVISPDLATFSKDIVKGETGLGTNVSVVLDNGDTSVQSDDEVDGSFYAAELPQVEDVTDEGSGSSSGSVLGGETLKLTGRWLAVPEAGSQEVAFVEPESSKAAASVVDKPISATEVEVTTPDLSAETAENIGNALSTYPVVEIGDGTSTVTGIPDEADEATDSFTFEGPDVTSVTNLENGEPRGRASGGNPIQIKGEGFYVPDGDEAVVEFVDAETDEVLHEQDVTPTSPTELELEAPSVTDLLKGDSVLETDIRVVVLDGEQRTESSIEEAEGADRYDFETLTIDSPEKADLAVGKQVTFDIEASGATSGITVKESGDLPDGVQFRDDGEGHAELDGTPAPGSSGQYELHLTVTDDAKDEATQDLLLTVQDVPGAPREVAASAGVEAAKVFWTAPSEDGESDIESYTVTTDPGGETTTVEGDQTSVTIEHLTPGTAYTFGVAANNEIGEGPSAESKAVVPTSTQLEEGHSATSEGPNGTATTEPVTAPGGADLTATGEGEGTLEAGTYSKNPVLQLNNGTSYFDVDTTSQSNFKTVSFKICGVAADATIDWFDADSGQWKPVSEQTAPSGEPPCVTVTVSATTSPSLEDLYGTVFAVVAPPAGCMAAPSIETQPTPQTVSPGESATFTASASVPPGCGPATVQWYSQAPGHSGFEKITGAISATYVTPPATRAQSGTSFEAVFTDESSSITTHTALLTVSSKPVKPLKLTPAALKMATAGHRYAVTLKTANGVGPYHFTEGGTLPHGLTWTTGSGEAGSIGIAGTPTQAGSSAIVVEVSDSSNPARTVRRELTLVVQLGITGSPGSATATKHYEKKLTATGGKAPYAFEVTAGSLPKNVHLEEDGALSGTPLSAGASHFTVMVTDSSNPAFTRTLKYMLNVKLDLEPSKLPAGTVGSAYGSGGVGVQLSVAGGSGSYGLTAAGLPPGLRMTGGLISGTPEAEGDYTVTIGAHDFGEPALSASHRYKIKVTAPKTKTKR